MTESCFKSKPLQQRHLPQLDKEQQDVNVSDISLLSTSSFHFQLPLDISCEHCVLRLIVIEADPDGGEKEEKEVQWRMCSDISVIESSQVVGQDEGEEGDLEATLAKGSKTLTQQKWNQVMLQNIQIQNTTTQTSTTQTSTTTVATTTVATTATTAITSTTAETYTP